MVVTIAIVRTSLLLIARIAADDEKAEEENGNVERWTLHVVGPSDCDGDET